MASNAVAGVGTQFRRWDGVSAWAAIAEVNSITGPNKSRDTIDVTSLDSTDGYREFIASFKDGGTVQLNMNFTRATYDDMSTDFESNVLQAYEIVLPDGQTSSFEFVGLVTELGLDIPTDDKISAPISIKISGPVTLNSGSGS